MESSSVIMLVDDSQDDHALMQFAFEKAGVRNPIVEMSNANEALAYLIGKGEFADRERYPLPCLIITDLKMPGGDGFELLEWVLSPTRVCSRSKARSHRFRGTGG